MPKTSIEWTEYSWNPLRGVKGKWHCTKVSPGCQNCYAESLNKRFSGIPYTVGSDTIRLDEKVLMEPLRWRKPRMVFTCSMTDLFHESVSDADRLEVHNMMVGCSQHTFQVLTKRPENALRFYQWCHKIDPPMRDWRMRNIWLGISAENQEMADKRIPILLQIPAAVRWVSFEPLLGSIVISKCQRDNDNDGNCDRHPQGCPRIDWAVVGGESGPGARPFDPEWGRDLLRQCRAAGVPFFGKQWDKKRELPDDLMVREMPEAR